MPTHKKVPIKRKPPRSLRLSAEESFQLADLALRYDSSETVAIRHAISWCHAQKCPTPIQPQMGRLADVGATISLLEEYYALLATVSRKFYPLHFPDEPPERTALVDEYQRKSREALGGLNNQLGRLRTLSAAVSAAQDLDLTALRDFAAALWSLYQGEAKRLLANDPSIANRPFSEKLQRWRVELLRLLNLSGLWFDEAFDPKAK